MLDLIYFDIDGNSNFRNLLKQTGKRTEYVYVTLKRNPSAGDSSVVDIWHDDTYCGCIGDNAVSSYIAKKLALGWEVGGKLLKYRDNVFLKEIGEAPAHAVAALLSPNNTMDELEEFMQYLPESNRIPGAISKAKHFDQIDSVYDVDRLNGIEFENYLEYLLRHLGYVSNVTQISGDYGADLIALKDGQKIAVQAKNYSGTVGLDAVQQVFAAMAYYEADSAWVITNSFFTPQAKKAAKRIGVKLIDRDELNGMIVLSKHPDNSMDENTPTVEDIRILWIENYEQIVAIKRFVEFVQKLEDFRYGNESALWAWDEESDKVRDYYIKMGQKYPLLEKARDAIWNVSWSIGGFLHPSWYKLTRNPYPEIHAAVECMLDAVNDAYQASSEMSGYLNGSRLGQDEWKRDPEGVGVKLIKNYKVLLPLIPILAECYKNLENSMMIKSTEEYADNEDKQKRLQAIIAQKPLW